MQYVVYHTLNRLALDLNGKSLHTQNYIFQLALSIKWMSRSLHAQDSKSLTLEEREEQYRQARARIFQTAEDANPDATPSGSTTPEPLPNTGSNAVAGPSKSVDGLEGSVDGVHVGAAAKEAGAQARGVPVL